MGWQRWCWIALIALAAAWPASAAGPLRAPWDAPPPGRPAPMTCPAPPGLPPTIAASNYYGDDAHSVIDPARQQAYERAVAPLHDAARTVARLADGYRVTGNPVSGACAATWLNHFAQQGALAGAAATNQATYVQGWMLGAFAITWLKVRTDPAIEAGQRARISTWLARVAQPVQRYFDGRPGKVDARNNHRAWAGLAVMAAGIAADRQDLFDWGMDSFSIVARQVDADGALPLELARRGLALHYHLFAAEPMVVMAELAAPNGPDLYAAENGALPRLVCRAMAGLADPSWFAARAGAAQDVRPGDLRGLGWLRPFIRRFPDPALAALAARAGPGQGRYIGGAAP